MLAVLGLVAPLAAPEGATETPPVPVAVSVHGTHTDRYGAAIQQRLALSYRIVPSEQASLFIDVDARAEGIIVEVRDGSGVISRQEVSMLEEERDVLVWLVVRSALDRAAATPEVPLVSARELTPAPPPAPALAPLPPTATVTVAPTSVVPRVAVLLVGSGADDLAPEAGARAALTLSYGIVDVTVDVGYRGQRAGPLALHAFPVALSIAASVEYGARFTAGLRLEAAPKLLTEHDRALVEIGAGPTIGVALPIGDGPELLFEVGVLGKLVRQGFLLDAGAQQESAWRAHAAIGLGWRWG